MSEAISIEVQFFLVSILSGAILFISYDVLRVFRRIVNHTKVIVSIEDILFWVISSVLIFAMMYEQNNGVIRGFSIMGMMIGMIIYNQLLSRIFILSMTTLINKIIWIIMKLIILLLLPLKPIIRFVLKQFLLKVRMIKKLLKSFVKRLKKVLKTVKISITKK